MKICITARGSSLNSQVDPRFGRCEYFIFIDTETREFEALKNPGIEAESGAGIKSAQMVVEKKVKTVLTGNIGPNAFQVLKAAGIEILTGVSGSINEAIEKYRSGTLQPTKNPTV